MQSKALYKSTYNIIYTQRYLILALHDYNIFCKNMTNHKARKKLANQKWIHKAVYPCGISKQVFGNRCGRYQAFCDTGADLRGGCRGCPPPPEMTCSFLIQLVFTSGHQSVTPFLSGAPPPEKNPGSAPVTCPAATQANIPKCIKIFKDVNSQPVRILWDATYELTDQKIFFKNALFVQFEISLEHSHQSKG